MTEFYSPEEDGYEATWDADTRNLAQIRADMDDHMGQIDDEVAKGVAVDLSSVEEETRLLLNRAERMLTAVVTLRARPS